MSKKVVFETLDLETLARVVGGISKATASASGAKRFGWNESGSLEMPDVDLGNGFVADLAMAYAPQGNEAPTADVPSAAASDEATPAIDDSDAGEPEACAAGCEAETGSVDAVDAEAAPHAPVEDPAAAEASARLEESVPAEASEALEESVPAEVNAPVATSEPDVTGTPDTIAIPVDVASDEAPDEMTTTPLADLGEMPADEDIDLTELHTASVEPVAPVASLSHLASPVASDARGAAIELSLHV